MALTTYAELKTEVADYLDRSDAGTKVDTFIDLAEAHLSMELRCREMMTTTDVTPSSGMATLPDDIIQIERVTEKTSPRRELSYISPNMADRRYDASGGVASEYTFIGDTIYFYPKTSNDVEITYYTKIPALSSSNTTNWLLDLYPNIYLTACLMEAARYYRDSSELQITSSRLANMVDRLHAQDQSMELADSRYNHMELAP